MLVLSQSLWAQDKIEWLSFEEAITKSKKEPRKILIDVYTDWCGWCKKMDRSTFSDPSIVKYVNENYYAVKLNAESRKAIQFQGSTYNFAQQGRRGYHELAATLLDGKMSFPTTVFIIVDKKEQLLSQPFPVPGFQDKKTMHLILSFIEEGAFENVTFDDFKKKYTSPYLKSK
ncbi:thioredoxin [Flammeovirga sp. SJP92]|nr:thioredoxin [Flammeovirga sp. SJP92]